MAFRWPVKQIDFSNIVFLNLPVRIKLTQPLFYLIGALILIIDALYNGYPIIYHDLSTYVANGFDLETPIDRPITYCLFVRVFSLNGLTLWTVILSQAYIVSFLIFKLMRSLFNGIHVGVIILTIAVLSMFTGLSWTVSQVMPDIFTSLSVIIICILAISNHSIKDKVLLYFLFLLSTSMHLSHISFNVAMIATLIIIKWIRILPVNSTLSFKSMIFLIIVTGMAFTTMLSASAKSKHVFFMGAMAEHGILKVFLDDHCPSEEYQLCLYKDQLPERAFQFVWDDASPVYKMGSWKGTEDEFNDIIFKTLTTPKYILLHIKASIIATLDQLITFKINDSNGVFLEGTLPYDRIDRYIPGDMDIYLASKQMKNEFGFTDSWNILFTLVIIISAVVVIFLLFKGGIFKAEFASVLLIFGFGILLNAWVSGTFANAINRLGCKMIWLLPFIAIIGLIQLYRLLKESKTIE